MNGDNGECNCINMYHTHDSPLCSYSHDPPMSTLTAPLFPQHVDLAGLEPGSNDATSKPSVGSHMQPLSGRDPRSPLSTTRGSRWAQARLQQRHRWTVARLHTPPPLRRAPQVAFIRESLHAVSILPPQHMGLAELEKAPTTPPTKSSYIYNLLHRYILSLRLVYKYYLHIGSLHKKWHKKSKIWIIKTQNYI